MPTTTPIGMATAAPYAITWTNAPAGAYVIAARATDDRGATTASATVALTIDPSPPLSNIPPQVTLTSPLPATSLTAPATTMLTADASDPDDAVARVQFFANGLLVAEASAAPYAVTWADVPEGLYTLTARATDVAGAATTSAAVLVTVESPVPPPGAIDEIVLHAAVQPQIIGGWVVTNDAAAASGVRLQNPNANAAKLTTPLPTPAQAFDLTFNAESGKAYRLWLRGKALSNSYNNDSVFVQFDATVDATGNPMWRIGTTDATSIVLEECGGCGLQGWGWADNGSATNVLGPLVYFATSGPQRLRIQMREDGLGIDQVVLSAVAYKTTPPGTAKLDATILDATPTDSGPPPSNAAPQVSITSPTGGAPTLAPATATVTAVATDADGTIAAVEFYRALRFSLA